MESEDEIVDPKSPNFNALRALYSKNVPLPDPNAPVFPNFAQETTLQPKSEVFNPLRALYSKNVQLPNPKAPTLDNLNKYISITKLKEQGAAARSDKSNKPKRSDNMPSTSTSETQMRRFLPHQQMIPGHKPAKMGRNILTRMKDTTTGPLSVLSDCMERRVRVKVFTRNATGVRGFCLGFVAAFDKHWNLALEDVTEVWTRKKKTKIPALGEPTAPTAKTKHGRPRPQPPAVVVTTADSKSETCERHVAQLMIRGEQIAIIAVQ